MIPAPDETRMQVVLIDLHAIAHMLWHVSGSDPNPDAVSVKTVERVRALASNQPHIAICTDSGKSFRHELSADYKATRPESDAALQHQIAEAVDLLKDDGFPIYAVKCFESDDLIATATTYLTEHQVHVTIVTSDKDLLALVNEHVTVKSVRDGSLLTPATVHDKFGVWPAQIPDYLALVGDTSDNIQGAKGIGPKTAARLLAEHGSLDAMYAQYSANGNAPFHLGFTPALATNLREFRERLPLVRQLVTLRTDAPINLAPVLNHRTTINVNDFHPEGAPMLLPDADVEPQVPLPEEDDRPTPPSPPTPEPLPPPMPAARSLELVPTTTEWDRQLEPRSIHEAKQLAQDLFASRLFSAYGHPAGVLATILAGRELGLPAIASLRAFHIIDGKPTMSASLLRALVLRSGLAEYFICTARTDTAATFKTNRKSDPEQVTLTYTLAEAQTAWSKGDEAWKKSGWARNCADMLVARSSSKLARLVYADILEGLYSTEEFD